MPFSCPGYVIIILRVGNSSMELPLPTLPSLESELYGDMELRLSQLDPDVSVEEGHLYDFVTGISVRIVTHSYTVTEDQGPAPYNNTSL